MKIALISDIHGNLVALEAVIEKIESERIEKMYCLGDVVGYGPNSKECLDLIRSKGITTILGNHEKYVTGNFEGETYNSFAKTSLEIAKGQLSEGDINFLTSLKESYIAEDGSYKIVHSPIISPENYFFLNKKVEGKLFNNTRQYICFVGHAHRPAIFELDFEKRTVNSKYVKKGLDFTMNSPKYKYIIDVGSVGQPRDGNKDSSFVIFDNESNELFFYRVDYNIKKVQVQMKEKALPIHLINRLQYGN